MNVPYSWLKEFLPDLPEIEKVTELLAGLGLSVESVSELPSPPKDVMIVEVTSNQKIESSDHLQKTEVTDGKNTYQIVCGAPNVKVGMRTALAKPGVHLPGAGFTVAKREMQGVMSEGVLCSPKELELYDYSGGLLEFGDDVVLGTELAEVWAADIVIELEITPNRADAFSILGVARDLAAKLGTLYKLPSLKRSDPTIDDGLTVKVEDTQGCPRFTLQRIDNITVKPSPVWLQRRLASVGLRPRNNIVDVTNYVTFELGHPSHAFDLDKLIDATIVVRHAKAGEKLVALNEQVVELDIQDLIITTPIPLEGEKRRRGEKETKPIGVAGVIGGAEDSISSGTKNVALEAAHWNPTMIRKTAKRHGLSTDAHYRYERGVDPNLSPLALARGAQLIAELGGGTVYAGYTDIGGDQALKQVAFRPSRVEFLMGFAVPRDRQKKYLEALGCYIKIEGDDQWRITVPSWRFDLSIEEDIIEEVGRLHGYEHVGETIPVMQFVPDLSDVTHRGLRLLLVGLGFQEILSYVFTSDAELARSNAAPAVARLVSPQGVERSVLRTALYPSLIQAATLNHSLPSLALFEIGRVFNDTETEQLSMLVRGPLVKGGWQADQKTDFYVFKGLLEKVARSLGADFKLEPAEVPYLHPGVSAAVLWNGQYIGMIGQLHPEIASRYELETTYIAELTLALPKSKVTFSDIVRQPHAERDLAIIVPQDVNYASLEALVKSAAGERLERLHPFDVYQGHPIPENQKSLALRLWFRHPERALRDDEIEGFMGNIISALTQRGYTIRDKSH
jgi:phenylalanyl-tRNA synthetase beta chain